MHDQPKYVPLRESAFFNDARSARPLVEGTVARGQLHDVGHVPDQPVPLGEFVDHLANAAFELSDINLSGLQSGAACLKYDPTVRLDPLRQQSQE